jgi:gliding motility-associated-like protein
VDRVEWDTDLPLTLLDPLHGRLLAIQDRVVYILVTDQLGCTVLLEVSIRINRAGILFVPNAFTPNGDGINDVFLPTGKNPLLPVKRFAVFDRWGNQVHEESDKLLGELRGWDGTTGGRHLSPAVFVVVVEYTSPDGSVQRSTGDVTLMR